MTDKMYYYDDYVSINGSAFKRVEMVPEPRLGKLIERVNQAIEVKLTRDNVRLSEFYCAEFTGGAGERVYIDERLLSEICHDWFDPLDPVSGSDIRFYLNGGMVYVKKDGDLLGGAMKIVETREGEQHPMLKEAVA